MDNIEIRQPTTAVKRLDDAPYTSPLIIAKTNFKLS